MNSDRLPLVNATSTAEALHLIQHRPRPGFAEQQKRATWVRSVLLTLWVLSRRPRLPQTTTTSTDDDLRERFQCCVLLPTQELARLGATLQSSSGCS